MPDKATPHSLRYVAALDGLRAIAVLMVFLAHLGVMRGGVYGVEIFFVLSGYLITEVLANSHGQRGFLGTFYFRRFLRLFPPLALVCIVVVIAAWLGKWDPNVHTDALSSVLYTQAWTRALDLSPSYLLAHTWSLSVEEQFYLVWPLLWILLVRFKDARVTMGIAVGLLVVAYAYQFFMAHTASYEGRVYMAPDTRSQAILIGAVGSMASRMPGISQKIVRAMASVPLLTLPFAIFISHAADWGVERGLVVSVLTLMVILRVVVHRESVDSKVLSVSPLVGFGKISYGFYLWHLPILYVLLYVYGLGVLVAGVLGFSASLVASYASYRWLERPALRLRSVALPSVQTRAGIAAFALSVTSIIGGLVYFQWADVQRIWNGQDLQVVKYGPMAYQIGDPGPLQADGSLAMWVMMNGRPDRQSTAIVNGYAARVTVAKDGMSIMLPKVVTAIPGKVEVRILTNDGQQQVTPIALDVLPPQ